MGDRLRSEQVTANRSARKKIRRACGGWVADWCYDVHRTICPRCEQAG